MLFMQICGNFTVTPLPQENALVILVVGGLILGIGIIPIAVAVFYKPYYRSDTKRSHGEHMLKRYVKQECMLKVGSCRTLNYAGANTGHVAFHKMMSMCY